MSKYDPIPSTATPRLSVEGPSPGGIRLESPIDTLISAPCTDKKDTRASSDSDESDLVYRDAIEDDVIDEKRALRPGVDGVDERCDGERGMENGFEGYAQAPRVSSLMCNFATVSS